MAFSVTGRIKLTDIVVDRSATEAAMAMSGAWIAFVVALPFLEPGMGPRSGDTRHNRSGRSSGRDTSERREPSDCRICAGRGTVNIIRKAAKGLA